MYGYYGGAISLVNSVQGYFEGNHFERNLAKQGGAIYSQNSEIDLKNNVFVENKAILTEYLTQEKLETLYNLDGNKNKTDVEIFDDETVVEKSNLLSIALNEGKGGAIFFTCVDPLDDLSEFVVT